MHFAAQHRAEVGLPSAPCILRRPFAPCHPHRARWRIRKSEYRHQSALGAAGPGATPPVIGLGIYFSGGGFLFFLLGGGYAPVAQRKNSMMASAIRSNEDPICSSRLSIEA